MGPGICEPEILHPGIFSALPELLFAGVVSVFLNPLTPELNPSAQRCLTKFFTGDFVS
jgi:hypothetical protein